ncbi:MAG: TIGR04282 family arsenosugar biosynthesis glycosyltransferase [Gammaproteobacteria bacterium]|nr:TIGR04282 family arsenosugar biosynthesis glycosyltransferase [Gammaproteobacteria bacterium]
MHLSRVSIVLFAKAPVAGRVKTRMMPQLTAEQACRLHERLLQGTLKRIALASLSPMYLYSTATDHPYIQHCAETFEIPLRQQVGNNLGERMYHALQQQLEQDRNDACILIGSDCPDMDQNYLRQAVTALQEGNDVVIGPAEDGGYVLLGCRRISAAMFDDIEWGRETVLEETRSRLDRLGWCYHELSTLTDLDRYEDLERYPELLGAIQHSH